MVPLILLCAGPKLPERVKPHLDLIDAHLRWRRARGGEEVEVLSDSPARAPAQLTVDALVLRLRGHPAAARRRLERVLRRDPKFHPAQLAWFAGLADDEPARLISAAKAGEPSARAVLASTWRRLLRGGVERAAEALGEVSSLDALADALTDVSAPARAAAIRGALEAAGPAWITALEEAFASGREQEVVGRLESILARWGGARVGPQLTASLGELLQRISAEAGDGLATANLVRLVYLESRLYGLCDGLSAPTGYDQTLGLVLSSRDEIPVSDEQLLLVGLAILRRAGHVPFADCQVIPSLERCVAWVREHPDSQAGLFLLATAQSQRLGDAGLDERIELFDRVTQARRRDLQPIHLSAAWLTLARLLTERLSRQSPRDRVADPRIAFALVNARQLRPLRLRWLVEALLTERRAVSLVDGPEAAVAGWSRTLETYTRAFKASEGTLKVQRDAENRALLLLAYSKDLSAAGQAQGAWERARRSFLIATRDGDPALHVAPGWGSLALTAAIQCLEFARACDQEERATALILPDLDSILASKYYESLAARLLGSLIKALRRLGRRAVANDVLRRAYELFPTSPALKALSRSPSRKP